eukprot:TRINITY_DN4757_c0_g1_i2.p1 TRINITY_DN4757_c0_g1~~TRINITY_DN4757_c0_g1_i2.p1  ORF type:complete len:115 (+),score=19.85 TRINITY_DN4757_c0_g1_i2:273-617(+)
MCAIKLVSEVGGVSLSKDRVVHKQNSLAKIMDQNGQEFWATSFADKDIVMVPWNDFIEAFKTYTKNPDLTQQEEKLLKHVLDNSNSGSVTPSRFNDFLLAFSPLSSALQNVMHK